MSDRTGISWCTSTWNPIRGCSRVSRGCEHCYAENFAHRFSGPGLPYEGLTRNGRWTGEVLLVDEKLDQPLRWRQPRTIFANSMSDLFHEHVLDEWIGQIFAVMALSPQHRFIVLTKRPERMREYVSHFRGWQLLADLAALLRSGGRESRAVWAGISRLRGEPVARWPIPNVTLGVSAADQKTLDERVPLLLRTPAARRIVSLEPLLGPVDLDTRRLFPPDSAFAPPPKLDGVIVGGESGPHARPCNVEWIRSVVRQCDEAGVAVHVKQLGSHSIYQAQGEIGERLGPLKVRLRDRSGADPSEWPEDLRRRDEV